MDDDDYNIIRIGLARISTFAVGDYARNPSLTSFVKADKKEAISYTLYKNCPYFVVQMF